MNYLEQRVLPGYASNWDNYKVTMLHPYLAFCVPEMVFNTQIPHPQGDEEPPVVDCEDDRNESHAITNREIMMTFKSSIQFNSNFIYIEPRC